MGAALNAERVVLQERESFRSLGGKVDEMAMRFSRPGVRRSVSSRVEMNGEFCVYPWMFYG